MQRQRGDLVPIGDALSGMGGPVKADRNASPQAQHHFTQADQVEQLVKASEADPDLGFMARMMVLCSLPRTNPGNRLQVQAQLSFILLVRTDRTPSLEILDERWCQRNLAVRETDFHCSQHKLNRRPVYVYGLFGRPVVSGRSPVVQVLFASCANCTKGFDRVVRDKTATLQSFDTPGLVVPLESLSLAFVWCVDHVNEDRHLLGHHSTESDGADVVADEITRLGLTQGAEQIFHEFGFLKGEKQPLVLCAHLAVTHLEGSHVGRETK